MNEWAEVGRGCSSGAVLFGELWVLAVSRYYWFLFCSNGSAGDF